jgi:serine/threonine protein kinase
MDDKDKMEDDTTKDSISAKKVDMFSLGEIIYNLMTLGKPFYLGKMSDKWYSMTQENSVEYGWRSNQTIAIDKREAGIEELLKLAIRCFSLDPNNRPEI